MSYEINLVCEDASRYNIIDHEHKMSIIEDAETLNDFLGVPLWNKLTGETYLPSATASTGSYDSLKPHSSVQSSKKSSYSSTNADGLDEDYDSSKPRKM